MGYDSQNPHDELYFSSSGWFVAPIVRVREIALHCFAQLQIALHRGGDWCCGSTSVVKIVAGCVVLGVDEMRRRIVRGWRASAYQMPLL